MINKILVANRGEIAVRVIRACKSLGIKTVAVFSKEDRLLSYVLLADESVCIGSGSAKNSYLSSINILSAAKTKKADAIHPGESFFAEDSSFATLCEEAGFIFVGPESNILDKMSDRLKAKSFVKKLDIPVLVGADSITGDIKSAKKLAAKLSYPVLIENGKGIKTVNSDQDMESAFAAYVMEAKDFFGLDEILIEKHISDARHIEVQIIADAFGNIIHMGERERLVSLDNQDLIVEAPCCFIDNAVKANMHRDSVIISKKLNYIGAGTIEYLAGPNNDYYFIQMNAGLQTNSSVSEMLCGVDITTEQIKMHMGEKLALCQKSVKLNGHAIECRINLDEDCDEGIVRLDMLPGGYGVRIELSAMNGSYVTRRYDSLLLKVIAHAPDRIQAINKMLIALDEVMISGVKTNLDKQKHILNDKNFISGNFETSYLKKLYS